MTRGSLSRFRRVPFIPQMEVAECGAAGLAMVMAYHGRETRLAEVREACGVSRDGANAADILEAARGYGLETDAVRAGVDDLRFIPLPAILHMRHSHFVVLERIDTRRAHVVDPGSGSKVMSVDELDASFSGIALLFQPGPDFRRERKSGSGLRRYAPVFRDLLPAALQVIAASAILQFLALLLPIANQLLFDRIIPPRQMWWLWGLAAGLIFGVLGRAALTCVRGFVLQSMQAATDRRLMGSFVDHLLHLPLRFFLARRPGDLMQRLQSNAVVRDIVAGAAATTMLDVALLAGYVALMLLYSVRVTIVVVAVAALRVATLYVLRSRTRRMMHSELAASGAEGDALTEGITAFETIRATGAERRTIERWTARAIDRINWNSRRRRLEVDAELCMTLLTGISAAAVLFTGGQEVMAGRMTIGVFSAFLMLQTLFTQPLESLLAALAQWQLVFNHLVRLDDVLSAEREPEGGIAHRVAGDIRLENVSFRYSPRGKDVLRGIDLHLHAGEKIALVGPVGHGKSTLARLLLGLHVPTEGAIRFDGHDLRELDLVALRRQIGVVAQEPFLFNDTIGWNIALNQPGLSGERLREVARLACLDELIDRLPDGFETVVGENGRNLSGGERQRLAVARAIAHAPAILLLDEATSALDTATERRLHDNLASIGCTRLVIAHRLQTVVDADRVLVLRDGRIAAEGTYDELLRGGWLSEDEPKLEVRHA